MTTTLFLWGPVFVWAGFIFFLSHIPSLNSGLGLWDFVLRKIAHMLEFAILTALLLRAARGTWAGWTTRQRMTFGGVLALLYAISDEIHQLFVAGRSGAWQDVVIDSCGIGLLLVGYGWYERRSQT